jgi:anti-sigma regulatory factor (Ser/Thr protein kinase)
MNTPDSRRSPSLPLTPGLRWRRVFPGHERELSALRRWLSSLLPECPERDDLLVVANELGTNAIQHTASGHDSWFAVEVIRYPSVVQIAVADRGGLAEPRVIEDPEGEHGRGLLLVRDLSVRTGVAGGRQGRLVWAQVAWTDHDPAEPGPSADPYQVAIRGEEAALARSFAGVPAWFGRSTLRWWAVAGSRGLVSAPSAAELAELLYRLVGTQAPRTGDAPDGASEQRPSRQGLGGGAGGRDDWRRGRRPGTGGTRTSNPGGVDGCERGHAAAAGRQVRVPVLAVTGMASLAGA